MRSAFIVDGLRTPIGRRGGSLKGIHAIDLLGLVIENLVSRNDIDPIDVDDVIAGCVSQLGEQTGNVGRNAALAAGLPETVPGTTVDRQCGSSQQIPQQGGTLVGLLRRPLNHNRATGAGNLDSDGATLIRG